MLNRLYGERLADCLSGWIDRHPKATESEVQAKATALGALEFDDLGKMDGAQFVDFPKPSYRIGRPAASGTATAETANALAVYNESRRQPRDIIEKERELHTSLGRFIYEFSQLEFMIREALGKALKLSEGRFDVIMAPYDFVALCNVKSRSRKLLSR